MALEGWDEAQENAWDTARHHVEGDGVFLDQPVIRIHWPNSIEEVPVHYVHARHDGQAVWHAHLTDEQLRAVTEQRARLVFPVMPPWTTVDFGRGEP